MKPDTLYVPDASPFMHGLTKQLASFGLEKIRVMSVYSVQSEDVLRAVGKGGEGLIFSYPKIEGDARDHFPSVAVEVMMFGLQKCGTESIECMQREIRKKYPFDEHGVLRGEVALKHIRGGRFMWITP